MIVLITGGTGTLGQEVTKHLLEDPQVERIRILSRNDHVQAEMAEKFKSDRLDFFVGDVRDKDRMKRAVQGANHVYHLAASKRVESAEYSPMECVLTNVIGTNNVVEACQQTDTVEKAIFTSTDKACDPCTVYGKAKSLAESIFIQGNIGRHRAKLIAVRYGNVYGSKGSVIEVWRKQLAEGKHITVSHGPMTRFFMTVTQAAKFVLSSMKLGEGGEIFIPKMKATTMVNLAMSFTTEMERTPARPNEKTHEAMVSENELHLVTDIGDRFVRWPEYQLYPVKRHGVPLGIPYTSDKAPVFTLDELKELQNG